MSPRRTLPESGCCSVAIVRISVDFPAPLGPRRPNIPEGMSSETLFRARTPFEYVFERFEIVRFMSRRRRVGAGNVGYVLRCVPATVNRLTAPRHRRQTGE